MTQRDVHFSPLNTPPTLVGRDRELTRLHDTLRAALAGHGSLVLMSGEAGVGKTALADEVARQAANAGARVLTGHCYDRTETPPYGPWRETARSFESLPDADAALHPPQLDAAASQLDLFGQARDFFIAASSARPLVLLLEDLHWADRASVDLLRYVAQEIRQLPLLLLATYRDHELDRHHPLAGIIPLLVREAVSERLDLRPLDIAAAQALVHARCDLPEADARRLATYLIERTEGNALFLTELLRTLEEERLLDRFQSASATASLSQMPVPLLLKQIVDERLSRLGDEGAALLVVAAIVGQEVPLSVWEAVSGVDEEILLATAERAEAAHLITASPKGDAIRFRHVLIRDVLYEDVSSLRRRRLHQRVAEVLAATATPDPDAVASHFQRAGDDRGATWLMRAGERAEAAFALHTAAERYEAAFKVMDARQGELSERGWLRLLTAVQRRYEDRAESTAMAEEAVRLGKLAGDPSLTARAQALLGLLSSYRGDFVATMALLSAALDTIDQLPPGTGVIGRREQQIDKIVNRGTMLVALVFGGYVCEARAQGERFLQRSSGSTNDPVELGAISDAHEALAMVYAFQGLPHLARKSYAAAVSGYQAIGLPVWALVNLREELRFAVLPYLADDLQERERIAAAAEQIAAWVVERGGHLSPLLPRYSRIPLLVLEGQWRQARDVLEQPHSSDVAFLARVRSLYLGLVARGQGDLALAWQCVHEPTSVRAVSEPGEEIGSQPTPFHRLAAGLALDAGDLDAARTWIDRHHRWLDFMDATLGRSEEAVLEAEWHRAAGDLPRARQYAEDALRHASAPRQPLALLGANRMLGILEADARDIATAERHFAQALGLADACRAPYERALTLLAYSELLVSTGAYERARTMLEDARTLCQSMDALPALARIEQLSARLGVSPDRLPGGLTPREAEVLRLVAAGMSNAEIADKLFISANTVKVHVASVLGKLGARNRAAATEYAIRNGIV